MRQDPTGLLSPGPCPRWRRVARATVIVLTLAALAVPLSACGKKSKLEAPEGATYPKDYPTK